MSIRFILGRSGSGKSERCLEEIRERLIKEPEGHPLILLVPEQATFQSERAFATYPELGGTIRAQVLSFHRLAWRVMQEEGGTALFPMNDLGKTLLIYHLLQQRRTELLSFQSSADQLGLVEKMNQLFTEFKRYEITPDRIDEQSQIHQERLAAAHGFQHKLSDLNVIYRDYLQHVSSKFIDAEDYLALLAKYIPTSDYLRQAEVWIDGFHGYTPQELRIVHQLFACCRSVTVTFCIDRCYGATDTCDELDLFYPTARTLIELQQMIQHIDAQPPEIIQLDHTHAARFRQNPVLHHLEQQFAHRFSGDTSYAYLETEAMSCDLEHQLVLREAVHTRAEVQGVARDILRLVRNEGIRYRDIAVMVRNMDSYEDLLRTTFTDLDIPHFFDQKRSIVHHPLVEFIRSAIEVVDTHWTYDAVVRCMKTDLLIPLQANKREYRFHLDVLENFVLAYGIRGYRWTDNQPWTEKRYASLEQDEQEQTADHVEYLQLINSTKTWVAEPLHQFAQQVTKSHTVKQQVEALFAMLEHVQVAQKLEAWGYQALQDGQPEQAREHLQIWNHIVDMFDQFVDTLGDQVVSLEQFAALIDTGFSSIKLALVPPSMDQVLIGTMERTRSSGIQYGYLLGINEGVIPARVQENSIINESERELLQELGLRLADSAKQKLLQESFIIYTSLTIPSRRLWLSYPLASQGGDSLLPSELVKQVRRLFPLMKMQIIFGEPMHGMQDDQLKPYIVDARQSLSYLAIQMKQWLATGSIDHVWFELYNWYVKQPAWRSAITTIVQAFQFENRETQLSPEMTERLYGNKLMTSVSRMEKFVACPFSHFASYGLRLKERRIHRLQSPDIGQLFHAALHEFIRLLEQNQLAWSELSDEDNQTIAAQAVDLLAPKLQAGILFDSSRNQHIARKLKQIVARSTKILSLHAKYGEFKPIGLEIAFGHEQAIPSLQLPMPDGKQLEITGRIDRVDHLRVTDQEVKDYLRVIDYKSSAKRLLLAEVHVGLSLQMLTYLDVVLTHSKTWLGHDSLPAGVLYFHVHDPLIPTKNAITKEEAELKIRKDFKTQGFVTADPDLIGKMDQQFVATAGKSELIPAELKNDGQFKAHSSVVTSDEWSLLRHKVRQQITSIGSDILQGHLEIKPYRMGNKSACQYCSFKPVCQYDTMFPGNEWNLLKKLKNDQVLDRIRLQAETTTPKFLKEGK